MNSKRAEFEAWAVSNGHAVSRIDSTDDYHCRLTRRAWAAWQAALAARQPGAQVPAVWVNGHHLADCDVMPMVESRDEPGKMVPRNVAGSNMQDSYCDTPLYRAPPAQGIDLGQFRPVAEFVLMYAREKGLPARVELAQRLLALIGQRDAAPGVGHE